MSVFVLVLKETVKIKSFNTDVHETVKPAKCNCQTIFIYDATCFGLAAIFIDHRNIARRLKYHYILKDNIY